MVMIHRWLYILIQRGLGDNISESGDEGDDEHQDDDVDYHNKIIERDKNKDNTHQNTVGNVGLNEYSNNNTIN